MKQLERDSLNAELESVRNMLSRIDDRDILGRLSFASRVRELEEKLASVESKSPTRGNVAIFFGGSPVLGSHSIDATFSSRMLATFQDMVSKRVAMEEIGPLASRGPVRLKTETNLGIVDVVRGSFGFVLEETSQNESLTDTAIKQAIADVALIVRHAGSESMNDFERAVEDLDPRLLGALSQFFGTLDDSHASIRIVEDDNDIELGFAAVLRARRRVDSTVIREREDSEIIGRLMGVLPGQKRFELVLNSGEVIKGRIAAAVAPQYLDLISNIDDSPVGRRWRVKMKIREIIQRNNAPRLVYTLIGLLERVGD